MVAMDRNDRTEKILKRAMFMLVFAILLFSGIFAWQSWRKTKDDAVKELTTVMELGERAIDSYFVQLEKAMKTLTLNIAERGGLSDVSSAKILLERFSALHSEFASLSVTRADGQILATTAESKGPF